MKNPWRNFIFANFARRPFSTPTGYFKNYPLLLFTPTKSGEPSVNELRRLAVRPWIVVQRELNAVGDGRVVVEHEHRHRTRIWIFQIDLSQNLVNLRFHLTRFPCQTVSDLQCELVGFVFQHLIEGNPLLIMPVTIEREKAPRNQGWLCLDFRHKRN